MCWSTRRGGHLKLTAKQGGVAFVSVTCVVCYYGAFHKVCRVKGPIIGRLRLNLYQDVHFLLQVSLNDLCQESGHFRYLFTVLPYFAMFSKEAVIDIYELF